jgi:branched-subunit amino acid ABC-type transport system permease component
LDRPAAALSRPVSHCANRSGILQAMDPSIVALLAQDGITNGAVYALLALALVLVFAVTRVIWIPSGEFVAYGTLTLAGLQLGKPPGTVGLLIGMAAVAGVMETIACVRRGEPARIPRQLAIWLGIPLAVAGICAWLATPDLPFWAQIVVTLALVTALGPLLYRIAYQPLAEASVLVLLIVSVGVHFALTGLGLWFFGAEGSRTPAFSAESFTVGAVNVSVQSLLVVATSIALIGVLYFFFGRTLYGKALRATALNRVGARLVGIAPNLAGLLTFALASLLCALSGVLIGPITTVYYDSGFLVSLKGFVGAIIGGLVSYPLAAAGALFVGLLEAFASYWASSFKEVIVFTLILPVLLWRSLTTHHHDDEE